VITAAASGQRWRRSEKVAAYRIFIAVCHLRDGSIPGKRSRLPSEA
jgi:hypothetical protein